MLCNANLNDTESEIVQQLVHDDIILRRDLPLDSSVNSLLSMGQEVINFTYDELRDFIISFYIVKEVNDRCELQEVLQKIEKTPSVEGVYKFTYLLAREIGSQLPIDVIERSHLFHSVYINTISNLDSKYYNLRDDEIATDILNGSYMNQDYTEMCYILYCNLDMDTNLNIGLLNDYLKSINDDAYIKVVSCVFGDYYSFGECKYIDKVINNLVKETVESLERMNINKLLFFLQVSVASSPFTRYKMVEKFSELSRERLSYVYEYLINAKSDDVKNLVLKIVGDSEFVF